MSITEDDVIIAHTQHLIRSYLGRLAQMPAESLPAVSYDHESQGWWEYWLDATPDLRTIWDLAEAQDGFMLDVQVHQAMGIEPTPETVAAFYVMLYGPENAFDKYVTPFVEDLEMPDFNVAWLLMHPDRIPKNFPLWQRPV